MILSALLFCLNCSQSVPVLAGSGGIYFGLTSGAAPGHGEMFREQISAWPQVIIFQWSEVDGAGSLALNWQMGKWHPDSSTFCLNFIDIWGAEVSVPPWNHPQEAGSSSGGNTSPFGL